MEKKKVACLYRVSTKGQVEENDIPMQKNACRKFIEDKKNWVLVKEYSEKGVSGYHKSASQRDILMQVRNDGKNKAFDILLVFMFDRLGRREDETPFVVEWFDSQGIEVWSVLEGQQRFDNHTDKLINYIRFWQSGGESQKTSARVSEKHKQMVEEGIFRGGVPPFGYMLTKSGRKNKKGYETNKLTINPLESPVVKKIFSLAVTYGYGGHKIAGILNEESIKTRKENLWTSYTVMSLLKNPIYKGYYVSGKRKNQRGKKVKTKPEQWIYSKRQIKELIIIDEKTWNKAEEIRKSRTFSKGIYPKQTKSPLLFVGLAYCGHCELPLKSRYSVKKWVRKKDGKEKKYVLPNYLCPKRSSEKICDGQTTYSQNRIDKPILDEVFNYLDSIKSHNIDLYINKEKEEKYRSYKEKISMLEQECKKLDSEIETLENEISNCLLGESAFTAEQLSELIKEKKIYKLEINKEISTINEELNLSEKNYISEIDLKKEFINFPREVKKMLLAELINKIYIRKDKIIIEFNYNFVDQ